MNLEKLREEIRQAVNICPGGNHAELLNRAFVALGEQASGWRDHSKQYAKGVTPPKTIETLQAAWDLDQELIFEQKAEISKHKETINQLRQKLASREQAHPAADCGLEVVAWQDAENPLYTTGEKRQMHGWATDGYPIVELIRKSDADARDAMRLERIAELEAQYQRDVYGLNNEGDPIGGDPAGGYANDNARLRAELAALKAQAKVVGWHQPDDPFHITANPQICANWHRERLKVAAVYAAPVAKQEVVMPPCPYCPELREENLTDYEIGELQGRCDMWEEVKRLNGGKAK